MEQKWANAQGFFNAKVPREGYTAEGIGDIRIHGLTSGEKDAYENDVIKFVGKDRNVRMENARAVLIQKCVYNQHGNRLFAEKDIGRINMIPAAILDPIYDIARRLSGMLTGGRDEVEDLVKNSEMIRDSGLGTGSQDTSDAPKAS